MTTRKRRALRAQVAAEVHPAFCAGDPAGCGGVHVSKPVDLVVTDKDGECPVHVYAIDKNGARYVEILFEFEDGPVSVFPRTDEARALVAAVSGATDLLTASGPTWSWPLEQVEAYADAVLSGHKPIGGAR